MGQFAGRFCRIAGEEAIVWEYEMSMVQSSLNKHATVALSELVKAHMDENSFVNAHGAVQETIETHSRIINKHLVINDKFIEALEANVPPVIMVTNYSTGFC